MEPTAYNICKQDLLKYIKIELNQPNGIITEYGMPQVNARNSANQIGYIYKNPTTGVSVNVAQTRYIASTMETDVIYSLVISDPRFGNQKVIRYENGATGEPSQGWNKIHHNLARMLLSAISKKRALKYNQECMFPSQPGVAHQIYKIMSEQKTK